MTVCNPNGKNVTQLIDSRRATEVIESQRIKARAFLSFGEAGVKEGYGQPRTVPTTPCHPYKAMSANRFCPRRTRMDTKFQGRQILRTRNFGFADDA